MMMIRLEVAVQDFTITEVTTDGIPLINTIRNPCSHLVDLQQLELVLVRLRMVQEGGWLATINKQGRQEEWAKSDLQRVSDGLRLGDVTCRTFSCSAILCCFQG